MIRKAKTADLTEITQIALSSKQYWNYLEEYFSLWKKELTITEDYYRKNTIYVFVEANRILGFYSLVMLDKEFHYKGEVIDPGLWLDHMFVTPERIGMGIGTTLFKHCIGLMKEMGWNTLRILADPHAAGFYRKRGWRYVKDFPSSIEGRTTPLLEFFLK